MPPEPEARFDVIYSAQAWHWLDPEVGFAKAARLLRPGGRLALYWNMYPRYMTEFATAVQEIYKVHAPEMTTPKMTRPIPQRIEERVKEIEERFGPVEVHRFEWDQHLDTAGYIKLIDTYSAHRVMPPDRQRALYEDIARLLDDDFGGKVFRPNIAVLFSAQTPSAADA